MIEEAVLLGVEGRDVAYCVSARQTVLTSKPDKDRVGQRKGRIDKIINARGTRPIQSTMQHYHTLDIKVLMLVEKPLETSLHPPTTSESIRHPAT